MVQLSGFRFKGSGFRLQVSVLRFQGSGFRFQVSEYLHYRRFVKGLKEQETGHETINGGSLEIPLNIFFVESIFI